MTNVKDLKLKEELRTNRNKNFARYIEMDINYRKYVTKAKPISQEKHLNIINEILPEELPGLHEHQEFSQWILNVIYSASAVTILEKEGRTRECKNSLTT